MNQLETLLNSLIQMGMKPFGIKYITNILSSGGKIVFRQDGKYQFRFSLRELVSLESGLWQFVCENNMVYSSSFIEWQKWGKQGAVLGLGSIWHQYRLLESALIPEEKLEKFLVENIKTD